MGNAVKSYKGFNKDMTCRGFQYEEGKEYEEESVEVCDHGFHACEYPLDCLNYYSPNESVYHEVEQSGEIQKHNDDTKVASTKIKIGAEISIAGLVKAAIEYTVKRVNKEAESDENHGASSATGDCGASSATGNKGASSATGNCGASSATGYKGASSATGNCGASSATGDYGASSATGNCGASSATGYKGASSAEDKDAVAVAWGYKSKAKGVIGSFLVFADWEYTGSEDNTEYDRNNQSAWVLNGAKMVQVDGENIKPDTWYTIENGEIEEVSE
mgnify:CR=1 FL=1